MVQNHCYHGIEVYQLLKFPSSITEQNSVHCCLEFYSLRRDCMVFHAEYFTNQTQNRPSCQVLGNEQRPHKIQLNHTDPKKRCFTAKHFLKGFVTFSIGVEKMQFCQLETELEVENSKYLGPGTGPTTGNVRSMSLSSFCLQAGRIGKVTEV